MQSVHADPGHADRPGLFTLAQIRHLVRVEFGRAVRYEYSLLCMIAAVDGLTELARERGYDAKERTLGAVVELLEAETRVCDLVGRYTLDRFLVLVPHVPPERVDTLGKRLVRKATEVADPGQPAGGPLRLSIGGGWSRGGATLFYDDLLRTAEETLAEAQLEGGARCVVRAAGGPL